MTAVMLTASRWPVRAPARSGRRQSAAADDGAPPKCGWQNRSRHGEYVDIAVAGRADAAARLRRLSRNRHQGARRDRSPRRLWIRRLDPRRGRSTGRGRVHRDRAGSGGRRRSEHRRLRMEPGPPSKPSTHTARNCRPRPVRPRRSCCRALRASRIGPARLTDFVNRPNSRLSPVRSSDVFGWPRGHHHWRVFGNWRGCRAGVRGGGNHRRRRRAAAGAAGSARRGDRGTRRDGARGRHRCHVGRRRGGI